MGLAIEEPVETKTKLDLQGSLYLVVLAFLVFWLERKPANLDSGTKILKSKLKIQQE
jgi:hypothetical protein